MQLRALCSTPFPRSGRTAVQLMLMLICAGSGSEAVADDAVHERRVRAHTTFLADDLMEGRAAGTRGHELAMAYVEAQLRRLGWEPAGEDGYRQVVRLREARHDRAAGQVAIHDGPNVVALETMMEAVVSSRGVTERVEVQAPAVFVGFGLAAPEYGYDDFASGIDVEGKIAVVLAGSPTQLPATARAHYSRQKLAELSARGAIGILTLETPEAERRMPWALARTLASFPTMRLIEPGGEIFEEFAKVQASGSVSRAAAAAFFARAPRPIEEVFAAAGRGEAQAFDLGLEVSLSGACEISEVASANVLGWLPGSDPALAGEPLVITAHLDHLGISSVGQGDLIHNGALDNALGIAVILAVAEELSAGPRLVRPVLFAALTAEEKGLLGAYHLSRHPPARVQRFVANLNIDMPVVLAPVRDVVGLGAEHSTLGGVLAEAAARQGFTVSPDPLPEEVRFVRSDQYPFVRIGVPALAITMGQKGPADGPDLVALNQDFRRHRYHRPSDDLHQPIDWPSAAALTRLVLDVVAQITSSAAAPQWHPGDFFGTRFGGGGRAE